MLDYHTSSGRSHDRHRRFLLSDFIPANLNSPSTGHDKRDLLGSQHKQLTPLSGRNCQHLLRRAPMDSVPHGSTQRAQASFEQSTEFPLLLPATTQNRDGLQNGKPRITTKHKLCMVRTLVMAMEQQLQDIQSKWAEKIPDTRTRTTAQHCALEKYAAEQSAKAREELHAILQRQQFLLASLQTAVLRNSLHSNGEDIFKELHFDTRLGREAEERERVLMEHNRRSLATIPSIVENFSQMTITKTRAHHNAGSNGKLMMPFSQIDITGCKDCTLVTSVFVSEIPHPSLEQVYAAALLFFNSVPAWMKLHFGIDATQKRLNSVDSPAAYSHLNLSGVGLPTAVNHVVCSELTPHHGMIYMDAITEDPLYPLPAGNPLQYKICGLTVTPIRDPNTGDTMSVTLRWIVVYRYNLLPNDPALKTDLEVIRPILNGDLITSAICSYLRTQQQ